MNREPIRRGRSPSSVALLVLAAVMTSVAAARAEDPSAAPGSAANGAEGQTVGHDHDHGSAASDVPKGEEKDAGTPGPGPTTPHMHDQMNDMHDSMHGGGDGAHDSAPHSGR